MTAKLDTSDRWLSNDRIELIATIVLAIATILTAWSAFEAGKWGGQQSVSFSEAGAARTESTRADTLGGQLAQIDVAMYIDWVTALSDELKKGEITEASLSPYTPTDETISGFLFKRFREEFLPAVEAWLATEPITNDAAPKSPFDMDEYAVAQLIEADRLAAVADEKAAAARTANQNGDNYVLTMVLFASVLFFAGVSSKMNRPRNRIIVLAFGIVMLIAGLIILVSLPILT
ncbi:MAG: hypothetical protein BMS9Abin12_1184 [Acidimicrobiia bacterium]|nr:MAG: hypothetical protein BMS9Abin12_1184 [Acidimicrobiia bacterium]